MLAVKRLCSIAASYWCKEGTKLKRALLFFFLTCLPGTFDCSLHKSFLTGSLICVAQCRALGSPYPAHSAESGWLDTTLLPLNQAQLPRRVQDQGSN